MGTNFYHIMQCYIELRTMMIDNDSQTQKRRVSMDTREIDQETKEIIERDLVALTRCSYFRQRALTYYIDHPEILISKEVTKTLSREERKLFTDEYVAMQREMYLKKKELSTKTNEESDLKGLAQRESQQ